MELVINTMTHKNKHIKKCNLFNEMLFYQKEDSYQIFSDRQIDENTQYKIQFRNFVSSI